MKEKALRELVARMRHAAANPMKTWSAGEVIAADKVDFWADEIEALLAEPAPAGEFAVRVPSLWRLEGCKIHKDFDAHCPSCAEELLTVRTENAWKSGYAAGRSSQLAAQAPAGESA